ncbi:N-acetylmuramidase domain-containing protein [Pseudomonas sp. 11/12A]|uniref:N-acetylmuramidase domain-containing protein n=1 Tax=Pseudomonas sp. 11/12A TaxID=1506582 RepID=UPI00064871E5|nr:N-acetylmuramidase domain-containing protein [Pseudomonas sp. 11/12A]
MSDEFTSHGAALDDEGMENALDLAKVSAAQLWAVLAVETSGNGFFSDRRPKILYERHVFSRLTHQTFDAQHPDISSKSPGSYGATGAHQYDRLNQAISLNRNAALQSASWGLGQTMGFNFAATGSSDVEAMIKRMVASENEQLLCTVNQLIEGGSVAALRAKDWANFARRYNGPNYAINNYDLRLSAAYQKFSYGGTPDLRIRMAQTYLTYLGWHPGAIDGIVGKQTRDAMNLFQAKEGLDSTTVLNDETLEHLRNRVLALSD